MDMDEINQASLSALKEIAGQCRNRSVFGKYELTQLVGRGAFSQVYHARDIRNGQSVAIKVMDKKKIGSKDSTKLMSCIKREASIMSLLRHPNLVRLEEVLVSKTKIYLVMEYVTGGDLSKKVSQGRFTEVVSRKYFQQLISAVGYCHLHGVYHRDLKPENILLDENGDIKVSDFGLSAMADQAGEDGLLHTLCGTPAYIAPEILTKRGYNGAKTDLWSCGVILYELTAGCLPFYDPNPKLMYEKIYRGKYRSPDWMSSELKQFLSRLLDRNPRTRITVDEIKRWFRKGSNDKDDYYGDCSEIKDDHQMSDVLPSSLNKFELIPFSPRLDLSGLFDASCSSMDDSMRLAEAKLWQDVIVETVPVLTKETETQGFICL